MCSINTDQEVHSHTGWVAIKNVITIDNVDKKIVRNRVFLLSFVNRLATNGNQNIVSSDFYPRSSIFKSVSIAAYPV